MVVPTYISFKAVGSTMCIFRGEVYGFKAPQMNFYTIKELKIYKTMQYNVMSWGNPKPPSEIQNSAPGFNSNVDAIITNLFSEHAFCQGSSRRPTQKQFNFCLLCHISSSIQLKLTLLQFLSSLGSVRVMARVSLAIRDITKNLWRNRFRLRRNFPCISREYSATIFRRRRFSL